MFSVDTLKEAITGFLRGSYDGEWYNPEEVEELLDEINYPYLLQAVRHKMETAYVYTTQGKYPMSFNYRGPELFGQRAALLTAEMESSTAEAVIASRYQELWLLEDMTFASVVCIKVFYGDEYVTEFRVIKDRDPWNSGMVPEFEQLAYDLNSMCASVYDEYESDQPLYEL